MDFLDVEVALDRAGGRLSVGPSGHGDATPPELILIQGSYLRTDDFIVTGCFIPGPSYGPAE